MGRLIDADALIKKFQSDKKYFDKVGDTTFAMATIGVINDIEEAPTIEVPKWIPCSERLPTEEEQDIDLGVLVTLGNGYKGMDFDWYHNGHWYDWGDRVIAWMPLPQPYKESEK